MSSISSATSGDAYSVGDAASLETVVDVSDGDAASLSVTYSDDSTTSDATSSSTATDSAGLELPEDIDLREVMLLLSELTSENTEDQIEFSNEQIETVVAEKATSAKKNVDKLGKALQKAKQAKELSKITKSLGTTGTVLTCALAAVTLNPVMIGMAVAMVTVNAMNETGATQDMIDSCNKACGNKVAGTAIIGSALLAGAILSGGAASPALGAALFCSTAPAMLATPENLESLGVGEDAAPWVSLGINIAFAAAGCFAASCAAKAATTAATTTETATSTSSRVGTAVAGSTDDVAAAASKTSSAAKTAVNSSDEATASGSQAAKTSATGAGSTASGAGAASNTTSTTQTASNTTNVAVEEAEQMSKILTKLNAVMQKVSQSRMGQIAKSTKTSVDQLKESTRFIQYSNRAMRFGAATEAVMSATLATLEGFIAYNTYQGATLTADAEFQHVKSDFYETMENMYNNHLGTIAEDYNAIFSDTSTSLQTISQSTSTILTSSLQG